MYIDIAVIIILLISAGVAFFRGFIREVLTVVGVVGGMFAALTFGGSFLPIVNGWFGVEDGKDIGKLFDLIPYNYVALFTAYAGIFLGVFIVLQLVSHLLSSSVKALGLGPVDRMLGIMFGLVRGILVIGILYIPFHFVLPDDSKKEWFASSQTFTYIEAVTNWIVSMVPGQESTASESSVRETLKNMDVLKTQDSETSPNAPAPSDTGYPAEQRSNMNDLIEKNVPAQENAKPYNQ